MRRHALALLTIAVCAHLGCGPGAPTQPWHGLTHATGWVLLGVRSTEDGIWMVAPQYAIEGESQAWPTTRDPHDGDTIALLTDSDIAILDFATRKEDRRLEYPGDRPLAAGDLAAKLQAGTRLRIHEVRTERPVDTLFGVWARVGPPDR